MNLKISLPTEILIDEPVTRVVAEAQNGSFCLLPRHIDFIAALAPGLMSYETEHGEERFVALAEGILVKCGQDVMISTRHAVPGGDLGELHRLVDTQFQTIDERERMAQSALARIESDFVRRFIELGKQSRG